jgi:hypothetical protein
MSKTDHHVYVWQAGYNCLPDSRCYFRKKGCENDTVTKATAAKVALDQAVTEDGVYNTVDCEVMFEVANMPSDEIEINDRVQLLQPIISNPTKDDWQNFRIDGRNIEGGLITFTLGAIDGET